jgi:class 3 adenylate cyclase
MLASLLTKSVWLRIRWIALVCCLVFTGIAFAQFFFSKRQLNEKIDAELRDWGADISDQLGHETKWDISRYNQIAPKVPGYVVLTNADFIGLYGFVPGLIKQVRLVRPVANDQFETVATSAGTWRIYVKTLVDGYVILGIDNPEGDKSDNEVRENAKKFGASLEDARRVKSQETTENISYAVIDLFNNLKDGLGVLPVKTEPDFLAYRSSTIEVIEAGDGRRYKVLYDPIVDTSGEQIGLAIVPKDIELEEGILRNQLWLIIIAGGLTWSFFVFQALYSWKKTEEEKTAFKRRFEGYFSPPVMEAILKDQRRLGGERREVSILFADIRSFTSLSEKLPPKRLTELLQGYFTEMTKEILAADGVVDKFIGDGIMAFWGAPIDQLDKADRAVTAAVNMLKRLPDLNDRWAKEGYPRLEIGIGVNTGVAIVGNVGSQTRFDYTLIGDEVNIASRLEGLNKRFESSIIISESTKRSLTIPVVLESLGEVEIRGREEPVKIYKVTA